MEDWRSEGLFVAHDPGKEKQQAHELIDQLDAAQVSAVVPLLQYMFLDSVSRSLAVAPAGQQTASAGVAAALNQARASLDRGHGISIEGILREFGLPAR